MPDWFVFALSVLTCFRLAELAAVDDGPGDALLTMRARMGAYDLGADGRPETGMGRAIICPYCVGVWIALALALAVFTIGVMTPLYWLAIAGGQAALQTIGGRR